MSAKVDVILLEDTGNLGKAGDIISISEGYARNFLFPQGKAALADAGAKAQVAAKVKQSEKNAAKELEAVQKQAAAIEDLELFFDAKIKDGDEIFGTISAAQISKKLNAEVGSSLKPKDIEIAEKITKTGTHEVVANLELEVEARFKVTVTGEAKEQKEDE